MSNKNKRNRLIDFCSQAIGEMPFQTDDGEEFPVKGYYVCPLCKKSFNLQELGDNVGDVLTLEDVPPKSLGGSPETLDSLAFTLNHIYLQDHSMPKAYQVEDDNKYDMAAEGW